MASTDPWGDLRALRSGRPGFAADPVRGDVFDAGLEQCEQLLRGAASLGYASRPLNLFYGLSQAGRAITAAWSPPQFGPENSWRLAGHGITAAPLDLDLDALTVHDSGKAPPDTSTKPLSSFPAVARTLGSASLQRSVKFVDLWAYLPEAADRPAPGDDDRWGPLRLEPGTQIDRPPGHLRVLGIWSHNWPNEQLHAWAQQGMALNNRVAAALEAHYPDAPRPYVKGLQVPFETGWFGERGAVLFNVDLGEPTDTIGQQWFFDTMGTKYRGAQYWFPAVGGQRLHPLIVWWAVLYALSMLARYEPQRWADVIRVNTSRWAVPLEHLLNGALDALPEVIFAALSVPPVVEHDHPLPGGIVDSTTD
jgi:YaaC-like Protein